jgi:hypothetical protein
MIRCPHTSRSRSARTCAETATDHANETLSRKNNVIPSVQEDISEVVPESKQQPTNKYRCGKQNRNPQNRRQRKQTSNVHSNKHKQTQTMHRHAKQNIEEAGIATPAAIFGSHRKTDQPNNALLGSAMLIAASPQPLQDFKWPKGGFNHMLPQPVCLTHTHTLQKQQRCKRHAMVTSISSRLHLAEQRCCGERGEQPKVKSWLRRSPFQ